MRGFINIDKPAGITSSNAVARVRGIIFRTIGEKVKTGHLGTLDPMATGVLPIALGTAARLFDYLTQKTKIYRAEFWFGYTTDTLDITGKPAFSGGKIPSEEEIREVIKEFIGSYDQLPPAYSAKSVNGVRSYVYARKGQTVELTPKRVHIYDISLIGRTGSGYIFEIECGGGTYIRSLARDIAEKLGTYGCMASLNRIKSGDFVIDNAVTLEELEKNALGYILPVEFALKSFKSYYLPENLAEKTMNGVRTECPDMPIGLFVVYKEERIVGIAENDDGFLRFRTRL